MIDPRSTPALRAPGVSEESGPVTGVLQKDPVVPRAERYVRTPVRRGERLRVRTVDGARVTEALHPAGETRRRHAHAGATISILLSGSFHESLEGHERWFDGRGALYRCAGLPHSDSYGPAGARVMHLELPSDATRLRGSDDPGWAALHKPVIHLLGWALRAEIWHGDPASRLACESLVSELVGAAGADAFSRDVERAPPPWLAQALEFLWDRATEPLTVDDLATAAGVHRVTLTRVFRAHMGITPGVYLRRIRLARALPLIGLTNRPLSRIAVGSGFYDQSHLTRWVRRETHTTPGRIRRGRAVRRG